MTHFVIDVGEVYSVNLEAQIIDGSVCYEIFLVTSTSSHIVIGNYYEYSDAEEAVRCAIGKVRNGI